VLAKNPLSLHAPLGLGLRGEQEREFFVPKTKTPIVAGRHLSLHAPLGFGLRGEQEREFFVPKTKPPIVAGRRNLKGH